MEITLNLTKEKCNLFQEYLHAAIRKQTGHLFGPIGSAHYRDDGCYEITMNIDLPNESSVVPLQLVMAIEPDGSLKKVDMLPNGEPPGNGTNWTTLASNFVSGVLASALAENLSRIFCRSVFCRTGSDLDGEYWLPGFRFAPAVPENGQSYLFDAERYLYIDQEVDAIDQMHAGDIASERALQYSARLSLILDTGLYKPQSGMKWFIEDKGSEGLVSRLEHLGFNFPQFPDKMPKKGSECRLGRFDTSVFSERQNSTGLLMCPRETRKILRGLNCCAPDIREAFDSCARLYQMSLTAGRGFPTIRLAYQVGAIEAITRNTSSYSGFSDFIRKEFPLDESANEFLDYLYGTIRSSHLHSGTFALGEFNARKYGWGIGNQEYHHNFEVIQIASKLMRQSIMNWVGREIMPRGET